ncbi:ABC transporter permease [Prevotella sp. 10(H)]|uniref:ABC transporter permease n=1 Tax=Prevotella sp. 10(H) TaxID=1158294 RepID=UPI0004A76BC6|nr:ABC transporter permease [Prevotella sp. 10(H)]
MRQIPFVIRRFTKSKSLRFINFLGLALLFACVLVSYTYIQRELSFDKFYKNADRIARLTLSLDDNIADGRIYKPSIRQIWQDIPAVEDALHLEKVNSSLLNHKGEKHVLNTLFFASKNLLDILDIPIVAGSSREAFDMPESVIISERLAKQVFGRTDIVGEEIELSSRRLPGKIYFVSGVYKDMPENTHFHADIIARNDSFDDSFRYRYIYLLMKDGYNVKDTQAKLTDNYIKLNPEDIKPQIGLMPMTDIHLHSHLLRELEPNGNIYYIYLIAGINLLLFIIVLFNLWLNSNVIFSYNKRYYQFLRMNGASSAIVVKDELFISLFLSLAAILTAKILSVFIGNYFGISFNMIPVSEEILLSLLFILFTSFVSLLPVFVNMSATMFTNEQADLRQARFSISNVKYMLVVQYSIVLFIIIVGIGIINQMSLIRNTQLGGNDNNIIVFNEQPQEVIRNYIPFRNELLKHSEIESVTAAMQLPGSAVRDMIGITMEGKEQIYLPTLVVGEDFLSSFDIKPIAGVSFPPMQLSYIEEEKLMEERRGNNDFKSNIKDNLIINKKALASLGFSSPEDAIGKEVKLSHGVLDYFPTGTICGVVDNFTYTNVYEESIPMVILQRNMFMNCFIVNFAPQREKEAKAITEAVWAEINPDYPVNFTFLSDSYKLLYTNEINAEKVVSFFSMLSFIITILGLITFMAFMIKNRLKEISIRKVNGATNNEIVYMLNLGLLKWVLLSFVIAMPAAWYVTKLWLENFAYQTTLYWWIFLMSGLIVFLISFMAISYQSLRASNVNPAKILKGD